MLALAHHPPEQLAFHHKFLRSAHKEEEQLPMMRAYCDIMDM